MNTCACMVSLVSKTITMPHLASVWCQPETNFTALTYPEYSFRTEPEEYYYSYMDTAQIIPCEAIETRDDGTEQLLDVVIFKNSERINNDRPPDGLLPLVAQRHITGILIIPVSMEDSGSTYQCVLEVNGEVVLSSVQSTLYVGGM